MGFLDGEPRSRNRSLRRVLVRTLLAGLLARSASSLSQTSEPGPRAPAPSKAQRTTVRLRILGSEHDALGDALGSLLEGELNDAHVELVLDRSNQDARAWVDETLRDRRTLLLALLDTRRDDWQLYIVDAARGRALARPLTGGLKENAAALEAVASILLSAVNALRDGLEVAKQPIEQVIKSQAKPSRLSQRPPIPAPRATTRLGRPRDPALVVRGAIDGQVASLAQPVPLTWGAEAALEATLWSRVSLRFALGRHWPARILSPYGSLKITRTFCTLGAGHAWREGSFEFLPSAAALLELLARSDAQPISGARARSDTTLTRLGGLVGLRVAYRLGIPAALSGALAVAYFPSSVEYMASTPNAVSLLTPWPVVVMGQLGVEAP